MKALENQPVLPHRIRGVLRSIAAVMVVAVVVLVQGTVYGQNPQGSRSTGTKETQAPNRGKNFGFQVPIPEIKLRSIIGDTPARKPETSKEGPGTDTRPQQPPQQATPEPDNSDLPDVTPPTVPRLPFERTRPVKHDQPAGETASEPSEPPPPQEKVPLAAPPKAPEDLMEAPPPRKEVLAAPTVAFQLPPLLRNQPLKETPKALRIRPGTIEADSPGAGMIALTKRRAMERIVIAPSQPEFDEGPPTGQPAPAGQEAPSHRPPPVSVASRSGASAGPVKPETSTSHGSRPSGSQALAPGSVQANASSRDDRKVVRPVPPLEMLPPERSLEEKPLAKEPVRTETAPPRPAVAPPPGEEPFQSVPAEPDTSTGTDRPRKPIPAIAMTPPEPDKNETRDVSVRTHPVRGPAPEAKPYGEEPPAESVADTKKTLLARVHPSPGQPPDKRVMEAPQEELLPSPLDADARESVEVRDYLRATAPVLEELSLLITTAPTLAIASYDPTDQGDPAVLKDVLMKLNSMKRALQILDHKTFAIIPPTKYTPFHATVRQSIAQTYQACDAIISFLNSGKEDQLSKIREHLSNAKKLMQKTRSRRG